jgi:hypothetical protein
VSKTATRITDVALVVMPVAEEDRALAFSVDRLGLEKRTDPDHGNTLFVVERN